MSISKEAIEAGARALFAVDNCDRRQMLDVESNWHGRLNDENRQEYRVLATAALTAAAPYIQAAALRDAADALESHWAYGCELKHDGSEDRAIASAVQMTHENAEELRARADQLEGKTE